jgi:hypothetical protein
MKNDCSAGMKARGAFDERPAFAQIDQIGLAPWSHAYGGPAYGLNGQSRRLPALAYFSIHVDEARLN